MNVINNEVFKINQTPDYALGKIIILDLENIGINFRLELNHYFANIKNYSDEFAWCVRYIYDAIIGDVIRILDQDPATAQETIRGFPSSDSIKDAVLSIEYLDYDGLAVICQEYATSAYIKLKMQLVTSGIDQPSYSPDRTLYLGKVIEVDHVVVQEAIRVS